MAENDVLRRLLDAGVAFTQMTRERAEELVRELTAAGEVQSEQTQAVVADLVDRSRQNTERLLETVRAEIRTQVSNLGLATAADITELRREIASVRTSAPRAGTATKRGRKAPAKKTTARKTVAKKATAKKATARKTVAKKATAKKATAKATAKKATARKVVAKKATAARRAPARAKATAKKATAAKKA